MKRPIKIVKKTLFSKNRITLVREENPELESESYVYNKGGISSSLGSDDGRYIKKTKTVKEEIQTKCESPLGFYYYKTETVYHQVEDQKENNNPSVYLGGALMVTKRYTYNLEFPTSQGGVHISVDTRPWMIVSGYKSMPDHFVQDLYNDLEAIFGELYSEKAIVKYYKRDYDNYWKTEFVNSSQGLGEFKNNLYLTLFGNTKGPRYMTDSEKILSHGFDLKTSFRKPKEEKK